MHMGQLSLIKCLWPSVADDQCVVEDYNTTKGAECNIIFKA